MAITYDWVRQQSPGGSWTSAGVADPFAGYFSDYRVGIRINYSTPAADSKLYKWRVRVRSHDSSQTLIYTEWQYRNTGTSVSLVSYDLTALIAWPTVWTIGSGDLALYSVNLNSPTMSKSWAVGTLVADYELRIDGVLQGSAIGTAGSGLGIGGYDLRTLSVENLEVDKPITNCSRPETITVRGDVCTLPPPSTSLFSGGWTPNGTVSCEVAAKDLARSTTYWSPEPLSFSPASPDSTSGKVGDFELEWNGVDENDFPLQGNHVMTAKAVGPNASGHGGYSYAHEKWKDFVCYTCSCPAGDNSFSIGDLAYSVFDMLEPANSFGYGWTSESTAKLEQIGDGLYYKGTGSYARWTEVEEGVYVPFSPGNTTQVEKDLGSTTARYKLIFRDQTVQEFDENGKLRRAVDQNDNEVTYSYSSTTGYLETVSDGNGRSRHYTTRADGQPLTKRDNDATTGRLTEYVYYPDTDPDVPNRLHKIIDPEGNETEFLYYTEGALMSIIDPEGLVASFFEYDELGRLAAEESYGELRYEVHRFSNESRFRNYHRSLDHTQIRWNYAYPDQYGNITKTEEIISYPPDYNWLFRTTTREFEDPNNPNLLTKEIDHNLNVTEMTYTPDGNLKTVTDKAGNITTYVYAEEIDEPLNPKHRNRVREIHRPPVHVEGRLVTYPPTVFEYDANGNLARVTDAKGQTTEMAYDTDGKLLSVTNRRGHTTEFVYEGSPFTGASRNLLQIKTPKGDSSLDGFRSVFFEYDDYDNVISVKDDLDNEVVTDYDLLGRVIKVTDPLGAETEYIFGNTLLEEVLLPPNNGSSSLPRKTSILYDDANRLREIRRDIDSIGTQEMRVKYDHDIYGEVTALTRLKNGLERSYTLAYDSLYRPVEVRDSLADPGISITGYELHCKGHSTTSARGIRHKMSLDSRCLLREVQVGDPDPEDYMNLEILDPRQRRTWDYDELGRMIESKQVDSRYGVSRFGTGVHSLIERVRYDELDRVVSISLDRPSLYLKARFGENYGRGPHKFKYAYDPEGNLVKATDPDGNVTEYSYFRDNRLKQITVKRASEPDRVFTYSYDLAGRLLAIVYPEDTEIVAKFDDGTNTTGSGWDAKGQLLHLRYEKDGNLVRRFAFTYDPSGNRASQLEETPAKVIKWEYLYDWLDRLHTVKRDEADIVANLASPLPTISIYGYDASDNRVELQLPQEDLIFTYVVDDADNLLEVHRQEGSDPPVLVESFTYDEDGNMLTRTNELTDEVITYEWDDFNKLAKVSSAIDSVPTTTVKESNLYDLKGIRRHKTDKNGNSSHELTAGITTTLSKAASGSTAPTISYVMGHQLLGAEVNGNWQYFLTDALGTVRDIVDEAGDVIQSYEFNEHGIPMAGSGAGSGTFSPKTYQGALSVNDDRNDSGLYLMGHRHYAADLGRFISRDPIGFAGGLNLFGTAFGNNPITFVDANGLQPSSSSKEAKLTFCADRANWFEDWFGGGSQDDPTGHSWLILEDPSDRTYEMQVFETGSDFGAAAYRPGKPRGSSRWEAHLGVLPREIGPNTVTRTVSLTPDQLKDFRKFVDNNRGWFYHPWSNCTDYAREGWAAAGQYLFRGPDFTFMIDRPGAAATSLGVANAVDKMSEVEYDGWMSAMGSIPF